MIRARSEHHLANIRDPRRGWGLRDVPCLLAVAIISLVIIGASWWYGGAEPRVQSAIYVGAVAGIVLALIGVWYGQSAGDHASSTWPPALVPLFFAMVWGSMQLLPSQDKPPRFNGIALSAVGADGEKSARGTTDEDSKNRRPITLYPAATREMLAWMGLAVGTFLAGAAVSRQQAWIPWILGALAVNGAALAFFGIAHDLAASSRSSIPEVPSWGKPFATFVNRNNAAGFLNLSLAAAIGLCFWIMPTRLRGRGAARGAERRADRLAREILQSISEVHAGHFASLLLMGLCLAGVLASTSRGGIVAATSGAIALLVVVLLRRTDRFKLFAVLATLVLLSGSLIFWVGLDQKVTARLSSLVPAEIVTNSRLPHWRDALEGIREHWLLGTGLGTYRYAYLPYESGTSSGWFMHAENQYLEAFLEAGIPGLLLLLGTAALVGWAALDLTHSGDRNRFALGIAGLFAVVSQSTHALFDFGLYLPANMLTMAWLSGTVCGCAAARPTTAKLIRLPWPRLTWPSVRPVGFTVSAAVLLIAGFAGYSEVRAAARTADLNRQIPALTSPDALPASGVQQRMDELRAVLADRPDDAVAHRLLAQLQIYRFRQLAYVSTVGNSSEVPAVQLQALWQRTRIEILYHAANQWHRQGRPDLVEQLAAEQPVDSHLQSAHEHLRCASAACPILPNIYLSLASLSFLERPEQPAGLPDLRQAVLLAPADPDVLFRAGLMADVTGQFDLANDWWRRALSQEASKLTPILTFARRNRPLAEILENILPASPDLAMNLITDPGFEWITGERKLVLAHCRQLHDAEGPSDSPQGYYRESQLRGYEGDTRQSITALREAIARAPSRIDWRLELAELLIAEHQLSAAQEELRRAARLAPHRADIRRHLEKTTRRLIRQPTFSLKSGH